MLTKFIVFSFTLILFSNAHAKNFVVLRSRDSGLFSIFQDVTHTLLAYEKGLIAGIELDYQDGGLYYDKNYGFNWWEYYFQPIRLGSKDKNNISINSSDGLIFDLKEPRKETCSVVKKYIHLKPHIQSQIDHFKNTNFKNKFIIGVHYRGTDKYIEAGRVSYEKMINSITKKIHATKHNYKLFIATDDQEFLNLMLLKFGKKVCFYQESPRSNDSIPVHLNPDRNPYKCGETAVIDCVLLSCTDYLLYTQSNLSHCSHYFNPYLMSKLIQP